NLYDVVVEDVVVVTYSEEYMSEPDFYLDDSNGLFANWSIVKKFPEGTQVRFSIKAASMGEYVIDFGIDKIADLCYSFEEPILLGVYGCEDYHTPVDQLPHIFVPNNYNDIVEIFYEEQKLLIIHYKMVLNWLPEKKCVELIV
ncbi:Protein of unknown function, partial [Cotesia congregata]